MNLKVVFGHPFSIAWLSPFATPDHGKADLYQYVVWGPDVRLGAAVDRDGTPLNHLYVFLSFVDIIYISETCGGYLKKEKNKHDNLPFFSIALFPSCWWLRLSRFRSAKTRRRRSKKDTEVLVQHVGSLPATKCLPSGRRDGLVVLCELSGSSSLTVFLYGWFALEQRISIFKTHSIIFALTRWSVWDRIVVVYCNLSFLLVVSFLSAG